jgi:xanthine dehydrogenase accessory factor
MDHDLLVQAYQAYQKSQSYAFATIIEATLKGTPRKSGAKMIVLEDGSSYGSIGGGRNEKAAKEECVKAIKSGKSSVVIYNYFGREGESVCGGQMKVFIEPYLAKKDFIICGGGHIGLPLSVLAKMMNFKVTIIDNRKEFASKKRFPHVDQVIFGDYVKSLKKFNITTDTYIMIVTQGNEHDFECLKTVIKSDAGYIGVISSKPKRIKFFNRLKEGGMDEKWLKRIDIPAGIDIGAQLPQEIAVSIISAVISVKNKDFLGTAKFDGKK